MKNKYKIIAVVVVTILCAGAFIAIAAEPPGSPVPRVINYDGTLEQSGAAVTGAYDFRFQLINEGGVPVWPTSGYAERTINITAGKFAVTFPETSEDALGDTVFETRPLYLRISVKEQSAGTYNLLDPAVQINAVPFAVRAERAVEVDSVPPGMIGTWPLETPPTGYLVCNGSEVSRTQYADLFAAIGTTFGDGDESTTFNLPDYRGMFLRSWDNGAGNDPDAASRTDRGDGTIGDAVGTRQEDAYQSHWHQVKYHNPPGASEHYSWSSGTSGQGPNDYNFGSITNFSAASSVADAPDNQPRIAKETRPRNVTVLHIIKW